MSLLSIVASSSAFRLPASPPPKGSSIDSDWSTKNKKQPGFLRLISAWYAMVFLHFFWHHENYDSHMPEVTGWSPVATIPRMQQRPSLLRHSQGRIEGHAHCLIAPTGRTRRDPDHRVTDLRRGVAESPSADNAPGARERTGRKGEQQGIGGRNGGPRIPLGIRGRQDRKSVV